MYRPLLILLCLLMASDAAAQRSNANDDFESRVRPLLIRRCYECHRRRAEGGLRLDSRDAITKGGNHGPAVVPGNAEMSLLWQVVSGSHDEITMPPKKPLKDGEIKVLARWINEGAHWPESVPSARVGPDASGITALERQFWSYQPVNKPKVPHVDGKPASNPIDAFVTHKRKNLRLPQTTRLTPRQFIRRLKYDLTGLPPDPQERRAFEAAVADDGFEQARDDLISKYLASPQYGERWAQHWLDLVRYADTAGDAGDFPIPEAWKYRNYVIDCFNRDLPYDQFVREQLAGDLIPTDDEAEAWRRRIATGYIAVSRRVGVSPLGLRHIMIEDTLNNMGRTFLALSIGCARCHDHKFDPIPTADYYALYGIFDSTVYPHAGEEHNPYRTDFVYRIGAESADQMLAKHRSQLNALRGKERAAFERYRDFQRKPIRIPGYNRDTAWQEVLDIRDEIRAVAESFPRMETALAVSEGDCGDAAIQRQGNPRDRGDTVRRGFLQILGGQTLPADCQQSGRRQLANWIASQDNPLTARVIANRLWHHHFGRGIVATPSDFGVRGVRPSHPELLDYLAASLTENNWSLKQLHRLICSSETYALSSDQLPAGAAADPENVYLWRGNRRRLDAEQIRDSILKISGELDPTPGQRHPFAHHLTYFFRQHEPFVGNFPSKRRSVYLFRQRLRKNPFLDIFDGPDGNLHLDHRKPTTTSLQSLYFMNSEFMAEQSSVAAERMRSSAATTPDRVNWLCEHIFCRCATPADQLAVTQSVRQLRATATEQEAWTSVIRSMFASNEFVFVD